MVNIGFLLYYKLSKHIADVSWGNFITLLEYKAIWNDKKIVKIDRFFPSSKQCNNCGFINQSLKLDMREWTCPSCKTKLDRDLNASKNILKEGIKISSGTDDYRHGAEIRPVLTGTSVEVFKKKVLSHRKHINKILWQILRWWHTMQYDFGW